MADRLEQFHAMHDDPVTRVDQIADAALRRFARYGFKRSSMDDIAREAGLAKATLYLHFKGKDDVFRAMLSRIGQHTQAACRQVMALEAPFPVRFAALIEAHYGTAFACFGDGDHLAELKAVMMSVAKTELQAVDGIFAEAAHQLLDDAETRGEITLARLGLPAQTLVELVMLAAAGAKTGITPSCEIYGSRLRDLALVFAAALTPASAGLG